MNSGRLPSASAVWANPRKFNYVEVDPKDAGVGTLVIFPNLTGIVVEPANEIGDIRIIYPSAKLDGRANEELIKFLQMDVQPKFIVPSNAVRK
jgi:hypothetical protein